MNRRELFKRAGRLGAGLGFGAIAAVVPTGEDVVDARGFPDSPTFDALWDMANSGDESRYQAYMSRGAL